MNILLIGSGGREHALAWRLSQSPTLGKLFVAPGNPGTAQCAQNVSLNVLDFSAVARFAKDNSIGLVVIGPEDPLAAGMADALEAAGLKVFGPVAAGARLEADKWFAKELMRQQNIPTGEARSFTDAKAAGEYVQTRKGETLVLKATGLAKGKGVTVCYRTEDAMETIERVMVKREFGDAGRRIVIEEFLAGPECSILALTDGKTIYTMDPCQDHKAVEDGDTGPMTGGMGAYCPTPVITPAVLATIEKEVLVPAIDGLKREGVTYKGVLYAGMMLTPGGPRVLEFNCRFGDPETQPLMMRLRSDLAQVMLAVAEGRLDEITLEYDPRPAVCVVAASGGYPGNFQKGLPISGIAAADAMADVKVFHAGTKQMGDAVVTDGGRVLGVTALGDGFADAKMRAYAAMERIGFSGMHFRSDIAHQAIRRW